MAGGYHKHHFELHEIQYMIFRRLENDPQSPGQARHLVREICTATGLKDEIDLFQLVVSELITNVLSHTSGPCWITLIVPMGLPIQVEVEDTSHEFPQPRHAAESDEGGRGLELVDALAERHVRELPHGKSTCVRAKADSLVAA